MLGPCHQRAWGGPAHQFEARYDVEPPTNIDSVQGGTAAIAEFMRGMSKRTYVCDVCVRCGMKLYREDGQC